MTGEGTATVPKWLKVVLLAVLIAVAVVVLFTTVFPWVERQLEDPTLGAAVQLLRSPR
ncbi:hypothetical protein [Egicoccus sp. AB-alg2]|uniref:hypothetical protein n=1 Tax=Egicoccus sp. AB-alg2 TaxID=3242693 RepID=UPI00359CEB18